MISWQTFCISPHPLTHIFHFATRFYGPFLSHGRMVCIQRIWWMFGVYCLKCLLEILEFQKRKSTSIAFGLSEYEKNWEKLLKQYYNMWWNKGLQLRLQNQAAIIAILTVTKEKHAKCTKTKMLSSTITVLHTTSTLYITTINHLLYLWVLVRLCD
jgi:hypothetical protein